MTVLVTGGRTYYDAAVVYREIATLEPGTLVVHGGAEGADILAAAAASKRHLRTKCYPADWRGEGRAAGHMRNARMLRDAKPDLVIAFPGGKGTADMVSKARAAGVPVREVVA